VVAKTEWMSPILDVDLGEALGLLSAMYWGSRSPARYCGFWVWFQNCDR